VLTGFEYYFHIRIFDYSASVKQYITSFTHVSDVIHDKVHISLNKIQLTLNTSMHVQHSLNPAPVSFLMKATDKL